jgi:Ca2+-binding RTX toxin-like protein
MSQQIGTLGGLFIAAGTTIENALGSLFNDSITGNYTGNTLEGLRGDDIIDGRAGDDLIRGGNGADVLIGGLGGDELHGDFGRNTYKSEKDGFSDLIAIKSDQYLVNWIYGKAGNNSDGAKCDIIEGLDAVDKIKIIGVDTRDITFAANVTTEGLTGIGIYGKGALEALYTGGDLTINQITQMTSGDASAAAMANQVSSYGVW